MSLFHALVLGIVQGLAEFLPISSSGHLELVRWATGWDDFDDETIEQAFDVAVHIGTLVGAIAYLWRDVVSLTVAGLGPVFRRGPLDAEGRKAWFLVASAIPAGITGIVLGDVLAVDRIWLIAVCLIVFGLVLLWADNLTPRREEGSFGLRDGLLMGVGQALALQPGVSRSGATISVARVLGFDRASAARLAFLMSLPVIAGAGLLRGASVASDGLPSDLVGGFIVGMSAAAVTGWVAVWGTLKLVRSRTFLPFVIYRVLLGIVVLGALALGA
ncbi:MAG: undecaprenyl-diphosphate phosphatase [Actinomycetota bacterium]